MGPLVLPLRDTQNIQRVQKFSNDKITRHG